MKGKDVYVIAKGLDLDEQVKLINLLKRDLVVTNKIIQKKHKAMDYSLEDAVKYLIRVHFNKRRGVRL